MSAPTTVDGFLELLSRSGLLDPQRLRSYLQRRAAAGGLSGGPRTLANVLVRDGLLTRFQAEQLLSGKWRNFVLAGKYRVLGPLGAGGMGEVYLCEHQVMRRRVAVKVLPSRPDDPTALERFRREARAVAQLHHPNIVGGHDIDRDGKVHFLVMEYIDGSTFHAIVRNRGPMDPVRAAHYVRQAALGLQHAHEAGLVHRDIKPSNLLLDRSGTVKILDLGLARFFHDQSDDLSRYHAESPVGTVEYMAPEQALDSHQADIRADIYSLGATFYFLLAGHGPFRARASLARLVSSRAEPPRPIREVRPDVPAGLAAVLERMMAREPAARYPTPAELVTALAPWTATPLPPPPPEEMPALVSPARGPRDAEIAPDLPVSLYDPPPTPTPSPARQGSAALSLGAEVPTAPALDTSGEPAPTPAEGAGRPPAAAAPAVGTRRRHRALLATAAVLLLAAGAAALAVYEVNTGRRPAAPPDATHNPGPAAGGPAPLRLLVPTYVYPADEGLAQWDRIIDSPAAAGTVVIVNPDSGPGRAADANYADVVERSRRHGVTAVGYVSTKYAARPLPEVKADVDRWCQFYPGIAGIFFDEQASKADQVLYYAALYEYVRKDRGLPLVVTNPGTECAEEYVARPATDVVCLVEAAKGLGAYRPPAWTRHYPADRFAALLCRTGTPELMRQVVLEIRACNIGYCYITDAVEGNPWGRLPRYWEAEVEAVRQANASR
jgi:serine/threonine protein kinase